MKDFPETSKNTMEGLKLLWVECGRFNQKKEDDPKAIQVFSGCVELCCMPQRVTSYVLHSKKKVHRLVSSCTLSADVTGDLTDMLLLLLASGQSVL